MPIGAAVYRFLRMEMEEGSLLTRYMHIRPAPCFGRTESRFDRTGIRPGAYLRAQVFDVVREDTIQWRYVISAMAFL